MTIRRAAAILAGLVAFAIIWHAHAAKPTYHKPVYQKPVYHKVESHPYTPRK